VIYRAFVSSTFEDLKAHRAYVITALRKAGISVDPMEDWTAATDEPKQFSQDRAKGCHLCVLLVGFRRGHVPEGETLSITQLEYQAAVHLGIDVLVFMLPEGAAWPRQFDELDKDPEIRQWRTGLREHQGVSPFTYGPSSIDIAPALARWIAERSEKESRLRADAALEHDQEWLKTQLARDEWAFAVQMSGGEDTSVPLALQHYIEPLVKKRSVSEELIRPFSELAETPGACWLIFGDGGSGKSTALLKLAIDAGQRALENPDAPIPLFVRLNFFDSAERGFDRRNHVREGTLSRYGSSDHQASLWDTGLPIDSRRRRVI
jgi:hypothetical protein